MKREMNEQQVSGKLILIVVVVVAVVVASGVMVCGCEQPTWHPYGTRPVTVQLFDNELELTKTWKRNEKQTMRINWLKSDRVYV